MVHVDLWKGLLKKESFELRQDGEIPQTGRQHIPDSWSNKTERMLTTRFKTVFQDFQKLLIWGTEGAWCSIRVCKAKLKVKKGVYYWSPLSLIVLPSFWPPNSPVLLNFLDVVPSKWVLPQWTPKDMGGVLQVTANGLETLFGSTQLGRVLGLGVELRLALQCSLKLALQLLLTTDQLINLTAHNLQEKTTVTCLCGTVSMCHMSMFHNIHVTVSMSVCVTISMCHCVYTSHVYVSPCMWNCVYLSLTLTSLSPN